MPLVYVEVDALVVYLLLQNLVVLVLHKLRKRLLLICLGILYLWYLIGGVWCGTHRELEEIVEVTKPIDDTCQLLVLLLQQFDLICEFMHLIDQFLRILDLPLLFVEKKLEHYLVVLVGLLVAASGRVTWLLHQHILSGIEAGRAGRVSPGWGLEP